MWASLLCSTPDRIRTCDRLLRRQMLYPTELLVHSLMCFFTMAIGTPYLTFSDFFLYRLYAVVVANHVCNGAFFYPTNMIKIKDYRVWFSAINTAEHSFHSPHKLFVLLSLFFVPGCASSNYFFLVLSVVFCCRPSLIFFVLVWHSVLSIGFEPMTYELWVRCSTAELREPKVNPMVSRGNVLIAKIIIIPVYEATGLT